MLKNLNRTSASAPQNRPIKVLQFGKGNFLRAFVGWMVDVLNEKVDFNGAIQIVQVNSREDDHRFRNQEGLYHLVTNGIQNGQPLRQVRLITAVDSVVNPFSDYQGFLSTSENETIRIIVSNTTEAGIRFDGTDQDVRRPSASFPGKLAAWLFHRFNHFKGNPQQAPLILPCELVEGNGELLRAMVLKYADHWDLGKDFIDWINDHVGFCNTLVDRIVPGFPNDRIEELWRETGYRDELPVTAEPYHLWVIQPLLPGSPSTASLHSLLPFERAGLSVKFTNDLTPYRTSKVRILNGAHTCMVPIAWLRGIRTVRDAIGDEFVGNFIREAIREEIIPTIDRSQEELEKFSGDVIDRFQNPFIRHELSAIALNSISKFQVRVVPTILDFHRRTNRLPKRLLLALAALILFYRGEWKGEQTPVRDTPEVTDFFLSAWTDPSTVAFKVLSNEKLWHTDLTKIHGLLASVQQAIDNPDF